MFYVFLKEYYVLFVNGLDRIKYERGQVSNNSKTEETV